MNLVEIEIRASDLTGPGFASALARAEALKKALQGASFMGFDMQKVDSQLSILKSKLQAHGVADLLDINMNQGQIEQQLMLLKRKISDAKISDILDVNLNEAQVTKQMADLEAALSGHDVPIKVVPELAGSVPLGKYGGTTSVSVTDSGVPAAAAALAGLDSEMHKVTADASAMDSAIGAAIGSGGSSGGGLRGLGAAAGGAAGSSGGGGGGLYGLAAAAGAASGGGGGSGGGLAGLTVAAGASGRALRGWGGLLMMNVGYIKLWHLALDTALETVISVGTAAAAAGAGIYAMVPTLQDVYTHLSAVNTVNSALGSSIPPLTGKFQALQQAMSPQTIELYGGALNLVNRNTGGLAPVVEEVVTGFDDWIAKLDIWMGAQGGSNKLLQDGVGFLHQFAGIVDDVGVALSNLMKADPGTAHFLLDIVGGAAKLLDVITRLPAPLLETAIAIHSMYTWGGPAVAVLSKLPGPLGKLGTAIAGLSHGQIMGLAAIGAAVFEMARAWNSATPAITADISSISAALATMPASQSVIAMSADIGKLNAAMAGVSTSGIQKQWTGLTGVFQETDDKMQAFGHDIAMSFEPSVGAQHQLAALGDAVKMVFSQGFAEGSAATIQLGHDIAALNSAIDGLLGKQRDLFAETGSLMKQGYSYSDALAIMDLAGVKAGDSLQLMQQKVANLITGYKEMSVSGNLLSAAVNAVSFASALQSSDVSKLNQGWDTFFQTISGGASSFLSFAQQTIGLYQSLDTAGLKVSDSNGKVGSSLKLLASQAGGTAVSMTGLNSASILAQQTFLQSASAANTQMDSLTTLAAAAGLGTQGTDLLTQANKDLVAALLPAASGSSTLTTVLYALAQRGGYTGADSFQQLSKWVGNTKQPMQDLQGVVGTLTQAAGNLTQDVQNLSTALGTTLNDAMATAILDATGGQKVFDDFATAVIQTGANSGQTQAAALSLANSLYHLTGSTSDTESEFLSFAEKALGLTKAQADTLWQETLPSLQKSLADSGASASSAGGAIESHFIADLKAIGTDSPAVNQQIGALAAAIQSTGDHSSETQGARAQLIKDLENAGLNAQQATSMVGGLQKQIDGLQGKSVNVNVVGSGSGTITFAEQNIKNAQTGYLEFHAAGGPVGGRGGPTADDQIIAASTGEYVVRASSVNKYGLGMMNAINAGRYAGGGLVDSYGVLSGAGQDFMGTAENSAAKAVMSAAAQAMIADAQAKISASIAAAAASVPSVATAGSAGGVIATMMKNLAAARGWTGTQWDDLYAVEMREAGFNMTATNPTSGAYGLAQFIGGPSEYATYGGNSTTATGQITAMLNYIAQRYGSPAGAWAHEVNFGWYDHGGYLKPGWTMAYNGTGQPEPVGGAAGGDVHITLELGDSFKQAGLTAQQLEDLRYTIRQKGGRGSNSVQAALGQN